MGNDCIFTYIYHKYQPNVAEYTNPMDTTGGKLDTFIN